ncbi:nodulation protein NfeD [Oxyplasma meridianum]|uniref:Nodulation protein NfeD n=1 Tax=Oxyplasma meridianum TaxID=3073602 RepID=A0AAX4NE63_9ARCH
MNKFRLVSIVLIITVVFLLVGSMATPVSATSPPSVVVIHLDQRIDEGSQSMVNSALSGLTPANTKAVIIELNTPGGILQNMIQIVNAINNTEATGIPVYTYIPANGSGSSAGSYIAMATDYIGMGAGSYIGSSLPSVEGGTASQQASAVKQMANLMESMAFDHDRNVSAAKSMVLNDTLYTEAQAVSIGVANGYALNLTTFIKDQGLQSFPVNNVTPSFYDSFISFLSDQFVIGVLIILGAIAILVDFYHGSVLLSIVGVILIALGLIGAEVIEASIIGIVFILVGVVLIFLEMKIGHGFALIAGVIIAVVGTFLLGSPQYSSNLGYSPSPVTSGSVVSAIIIVILAIAAALYLRKIALSIKTKKTTGSEAIIEKKGVVKVEINPVGWISVEGVQWKARSVDGSKIDSGKIVRVIGREGLTLVVMPVTG